MILCYPLLNLPYHRLVLFCYLSFSLSTDLVCSFSHILFTWPLVLKLPNKILRTDRFEDEYGGWELQGRRSRATDLKVRIGMCTFTVWRSRGNVMIQTWPRSPSALLLEQIQVEKKVLWVAWETKDGEKKTNKSKQKRTKKKKPIQESNIRSGSTTRHNRLSHVRATSHRTRSRLVPSRWHGKS